MTNHVPRPTSHEFMTHQISNALKILAHFWLEEVTLDDVPTIAALPELAQTLPNPDETALTELAVAYQRLFGFNLPPYESLFTSEALTLMGPASQQVQSLYRQAGWQIPPQLRAGAPDHLGLELRALAGWLARGQPEPAAQLLGSHLALWVPPFILTLRRLSPPPFYQVLADLTLDLLLTILPDALPVPHIQKALHLPEQELALRDIVTWLLTPVHSGLFLTREDLAHFGQALELPLTVGERFKMLDTLFRQAGQYELGPALLNNLDQLMVDTDQDYRSLATEYPGWAPYATIWCNRLERARALTAQLKTALIREASPEE